MFKLAPGSRDEKAWETWLEETKKQRKAVDETRERAADMATIKVLQNKWGISE